MLHICIKLIELEETFDYLREALTSLFLVFWVKVATGQPHEGSTYSARKDCQMALNRAEYARVKLGELGRTCEIMLDPQT